MALPFPNIDPALFRFGPFNLGPIAIGQIAIRWYAVAYIVGLLSGWRYTRWLVSKPPYAMKPEQVDDFLVWATLGVVLGGRIGYVLFYKPLYYLAHPMDALMVWQGGMSFHGGALGVILAIVLFARRNKLDLLAVGDTICTVVPIGLFFGRIANFINGELWGRPAPEDLPWAIIFPGGGPVPRHPSQLYEAGLEGLVLFTVMFLVWRNENLRARRGFLSGCFLGGYGLARITSEFFRQPDAHLGFLWGGATMGQLLSIPLVIVGLIFILRAKPAA